jgi:anhydro-N-acetylmuramic acid kinase
MAAMTSAIAFPTYVVGLMSGTSADGVDAAILYTDGEQVVQAHESLFMPYTGSLRRSILGLMHGEGSAASIALALTRIHIEAVQALLLKTRVPTDAIHLIGFHGQTIRHAPAKGVTEQIGDAALMARELGISVVADFRSADVQAGGQGAPLVPLYHAALASRLPKPLMVVNIGGVANVTWLGPKGEIIAFDCGPGNALIDDWVAKHTGARCDTGGALAALGTVDVDALYDFLKDPFFDRPLPKSLDRNHFHPAVNGSLEDGAATLTAMTAAGIVKACVSVPDLPKRLLIAGGGRHNAALMEIITHYSDLPAEPVESVGWDGDMLEAQAFAYLAARSVRRLPLSLPTTTGVREPISGGVLHEPSGK